jgi:dolichol-phosphate mannosyltransferase
VVASEVMSSKPELPETVPPQAKRGPGVAVIVPTLNEAGNVSILVRRLRNILAGEAWEVIFVDDGSTDGTLVELQALSQADARVRYIHRIDRRGLSSAVVEGMLSTSAPILAVIDADLQHDETRLPAMLDILRRDGADIVVGSRYVDAGGIGSWSGSRVSMSRAATRLASSLFPVRIADPMSGFFAVTRPAFLDAAHSLSRQGYKILLDILLSSPRTLRVHEVPYTFADRQHGESKLDQVVILDYILMLLDKKVGHIVPPRFFMFAAVGGSGVLVHFGILALAMTLSPSFTWAQATATLVAMTYNFFLNNILTYRDKRLRGAGPILRGLASFYAVCSIGAVSNVGVASVMFERDYSWWMAAIGGILVGLVWNYVMTATFTWRR